MMRAITVLACALLLSACAAPLANPPLVKYAPEVGYRFDRLAPGDYLLQAEAPVRAPRQSGVVIVMIAASSA